MKMWQQQVQRVADELGWCRQDPGEGVRYRACCSRVMVEAESEELCRKYVDQVVDVVRRKGHAAE